MGDQDGGTNWWDSSRTPASESATAAAVPSSSSSLVFPQEQSLQSQAPLHQWNHPLILGDKAGGGFRSMLEQGMAPFSSATDQQFLDASSSSSSSVYGNFQALMGASPSPQQHQHQQQPDFEGLGLMGGWANSTNKVVDHHQFLKPTSMDSNKPAHSPYLEGSFWNMAAPPSTFFPLPSPLIQQHQSDAPFFDHKPQLHNVMEVRDTSGPGRKTGGSSSEQTTTTTSKRSRNEGSSTSLPPFKVRKEKMGDRITALQQLVSPFGKTDTASVLSEAIEYIKFLHEQVNVLSTPYLKSGASSQHQQTSDKSKDPEGAVQDLRSRGLCLVPVSSTFPVAHETTVDFWTPTFGGTFR